MITTLALLAGGLATRLRPLTEVVPKSLIKINGKPFIAHQLGLLRKNGIKKVIICAGFLGEKIMDFVGDGQKFGLKVEYSFDGDKLLGTGGALKKASPLLDETFFVMYGDSFLPIDFQKVSQYFEENKKNALMTVLKNENKWDKSNVFFKNGQIIEHRKNAPSPKMKHIDYGLEIMHKKCLNDIKEDEPTDLSEIFSKMSLNNDLLGYEINQRFYEIGSFSGIEDFKKYLK